VLRLVIPPTGLEGVTVDEQGAAGEGLVAGEPGANLIKLFRPKFPEKSNLVTF
jgi:hypothetical protein